MVSLRVYNTLSREKEVFRPVTPGLVRFYSCGPTVYNYAHIGNFRAYVFADLVKRVLLRLGYRVLHVMNITDVDDKTIRDSQREGVSLQEFTERYTRAFMEDLAKLQILPATHYPRATEYIPRMVEMIKQMLELGYAYKAEDGIYYRVSRFERYGELARLDMSKLKAGGSGRVRRDEYGKEDPADFALWKYWTPEDGDVYWETELGNGRPGWHIECSAMSTALLGPHLDIHSGGVDLVFPHHTNEIAQSEAVCTTCREQGLRFVNYWLHNEHLLVEGRKMSKSLGNVYTLRDLEAKGYRPTAVRALLLSGHYRQQLNFTFQALEGMEALVDRTTEFYVTLQALRESRRGMANQSFLERVDAFADAFLEAVADDFDTPRAFAVLNDFMHFVHARLPALQRGDVERALSVFEEMNSILSITLPLEPLTPEEEALLAERRKAREEKDYAKADRLRDTLVARGVIVKDLGSETIAWKPKEQRNA